MSGSTSVDTAIGSFFDGVFAVSESIRFAAQDPADQVNLLAQLAAFSPTVLAVDTSPLGAATSATQTAIAAVCRRAALTSLAIACSDYHPTSSNDAQSVLSTVVPLFDREITLAADAEDDDTYLAMRALRSAVVADMVTRGANLPALITVATPEPMPGLVLGYQLYQDASRSDDLIVRADPIHPAFFPTTFQALSS